MTVTVETLAIGSVDGPRVWIVTRRVGGHLDIAQVPEEVDCEGDARQWAAWRWGVAECDVKFSPLQVVEIHTAE